MIDDVIFRETQGKDLSKTKLTKVEKVAIVQSLYTKGFFDLKELQTAILEENGRISFLAKSENRPASPSDLKSHS